MKNIIVAAIAVSSVAAATAADAKPRHHHHRHHSHHARQVPAQPVNPFAAFMQNARANARAAVKTSGKTRGGAYTSFGRAGGFGGGSSLIATARSYTGTNPTRRSRQWCGEFMGLVVRKTGGKIPEGYAKASSWAKLPRTTEHPGAVAVMPHHVGIVTGTCDNGKVKIVSGNHGHRVGEGCYPRRRIIAFVQP